MSTGNGISVEYEKSVLFYRHRIKNYLVTKSVLAFEVSVPVYRLTSFIKSVY